METEPEFSPQLDQLETQWTVFRRAHQASAVTAADARNLLVLRYAPAIRGYVMALTRNQAETDELTQDVMVRLLQGDFAGADPSRGRFRDFLKISVRNMVRNHWDRLNRREKPGVETNEPFELEPNWRSAAEGQDQDWIENWRSTLIDIGLSRLQQYQASHVDSVAYSVMQLRSSFPEMDSTELAVKLTATVGREISATTCRQHLKRARLRFAEFIVEEIAQGLESADQNQIQEELIDVGLYEYIRDVLPANWQTPRQTKESKNGD